MRQLQKFPEADRIEIRELIKNKKFSNAALLWKRHVGGELKKCLETVQLLCRQLP
jgi:ribosomal 50S subunit-associated protein YjgA (DUF615 family)